MCLRIGTIWGPLGLPDSPFFALPRLLSAAVWGEDPDLTPPRPPAYEYDVERAVPDYVGWLRRHDR